jgi:hypothetical protein
VLNAFKLLASVEVTEFHAREVYSSLGPTRVKYNSRRLSVDEKEKVNNTSSSKNNIIM